jgi:hypothetical protein
MPFSFWPTMILSAIDNGPLCHWRWSSLLSTMVLSLLLLVVVRFFSMAVVSAVSLLLIEYSSALLVHSCMKSKSFKHVEQTTQGWSSVEVVPADSNQPSYNHTVTYSMSHVTQFSRLVDSCQMTPRRFVRPLVLSLNPRATEFILRGPWRGARSVLPRTNSSAL